MGQLISSTDVLGRTTEQVFDAAGNLLKVVCPNGDEESFSYDSSGRLVSSRDRAGLTTYFSYDVMGRVVKAFDNADNEMTYAYDERGSLTEQKDVIGRTALYEYDIFGRIVKSMGIDTAETSYIYNTRDDLVGILDAEGKSTAYEYDGAGNLIKTTEPGEAVYQYVYDKLNRLAKKTNPLGAETLYTYNKDSSLTGKTDGNGVQTGYVYDALQRPVAYIDGNGGETSYFYDAMDRVLSITTPEGNKESYTYDKAGRMRSVTDPNGLTTSYSYDLMDNLVKQVSPLEAETSYTYDKHDIITGRTDAKGNTTAYEVDLNGLVKSQTNPDGGVYTYSYDKVHRLTGITTPLGLQKTFTYDTRGNIIKSADSLNRTENYTYDIMHRVLTAENALGGVGTYTYDIRGNMAGYTDALGYTTGYTWNLIDDLVAATDPEGKTTAVGYDKEGHITSINKPGERITGYAYDNNYNVTGITDPKGYLYQRSYDKDDRLTGTKNPLSETEKYTYDAGSRLTAFTDRMNLTEHYTWGKHNNLTSRTATGGEKTNYGYDILGNLIYVQDPMGQRTKYTYDSMNNLTGVTDAMGRKTTYTYDLEQNLTSVTDASGRTEQLTYDAGSRRTSYTMNGGNSVRYDYDALNDLVEKTYLDENGEVQESIGNTVSEENPSGVLYGYDLLGQRVSMMDTSGDSAYTYDGLGRITSVTTYRKPAEAGADTADKEDGETVRYEYDGCDQLSAIIYPDGTKVSYTYDKNDNLTAVTDRNGKITTYVYDAINRVTEIHRPNGISTYNTYNARDQIVSLKNTCDECGWVVSQYDYTYDDNGYIATEKAVESLYDYAWDDKHNGKHEDGRHDDKMPHGTKHNGKHDKDSEYNFQLVETDREFTYDENGRLLSSREQEENSGLTTYEYTYDAVGNRLSYVKRTQTTKHPNKTDVAESAFYQYNDANQLVSAKLFDGKKNTTVTYTYDENGNLISEIGKYGTDQVETYYDYTVENRLQAVYDADELLMAAAYDGDGNRVFQLNYNLHTDEDWKDNSGNGNGNNKDNAGSGNNGNGSSGNNSNNGNGNGNSGNNGNGNGNGNGSTGNNGNPGNSGNGKGDGNTGNNGNGNGNSGNNGNGNGNNKENSKSEGTDDAGYGNATNAEEHNSQNQSGILFPIEEEISQTETDLIAMIKTTGKEKNYELIEYISNVNTQYTQVLLELNENGAMDAAYTYGVSRLTEDRFTGESNFYLYDPAGNVAGITDQDGYLWQSYRYDAFGNATFGSPQYDNEYTFNAESYNPNIQSQYLRARYYDTVKGNFLTEDSYLGDIRNPLTLNRYSYCIGNPLYYRDPSGYEPTGEEFTKIYNYAKETYSKGEDDQGWLKEYYKMSSFLEALHIVRGNQYSSDYVINYDYAPSMNQNYVEYTIGKAVYLARLYYCGSVSIKIKTVDKWLDLYSAPTVNQRGRFVQIPLDRPRMSGEGWGSPSWKSEEPLLFNPYTQELTYINYLARDIIDNYEEISVPNDEFMGMVRSEVYGIDRYWIAVGPRVMDEDYPFTGNTILAEEMNYGAMIDVILRDSDYNIYFVPAIVGDIKEHTLDNAYGEKVKDDKGNETDEFVKEINENTILTNGIYQTGYSWVTRELDKQYKPPYNDLPNGAVVEFIRNKEKEGIPDNMTKTAEFDILGLIVYDDSVSNYTIKN